MLRVVGAVFGTALGLAAIDTMQFDSPTRTGRRTGDVAETGVAAARRRALAWSTPECMERMRAAVAKADTERAVEDAAWAACPGHPDASE